MNEELKYCENANKNSGAASGGGEGGRVDVNEELKF